MPGAGPAMWWTRVDLLPQHSSCQVFKVQGRPASTAHCPALSWDGPLQRRRKLLARRGSEDLSELQEGGAGSVGRELVADVGGGTSGEAGLCGEPQNHPHPL